MRSIKAKLTFLNFLEFAIWGSYLTSLGNFLANNGLARSEERRVGKECRL